MGDATLYPDDFLDRTDHATATARLKAQDAAARRAYAAGSRDGAREMRLKAARLVASMNCCCYILEFADDDFAGLIRSNPDDNDREIVSHDPRCPAALAEAIRRLPDGGEGE